MMTTRNAAAPGGHVDSYYAATAHPLHPRAPLAGAASADVCIVGAGFTGLSAALELTGRGFSVIVLEGERIGWGASGRNGGQLVNGYSRALDVIGRRYGADAERALGSMALEGGDIIRQRVRDHAIECDLVPGNVIAAFSPRQLRGLEHEAEMWRRHGHDAIEIVDRPGLPGIVANDRYVGALLDRRGGHFHPLNYLLGEAAVIEARGGRIHEATRVIRIDTASRRPRAIVADGVVEADKILLCGNAYLGGAVPALSSRVMPVSSQIVATEPLGDLAAELLPANFAIEDANYILDYYRRTPDHRLLFGGGVIYGGRDPASIEARLRPNLDATFPQLRGVRIDHAWSGNFALTLSRVPQIGRLTDSVYFSHGDSGHGVTTTQLLGRLLAEGVAGQLERFDAFATLPYFRFPGGRALRVPLTALGAWYYTLRDRLGW